MSRTRREVSTFLRFAAVGAVGFLVDGALLQVFAKAFALTPVIARLPSFAIAVALTFQLNRVWGFRAVREPAGPQAVRYIAVQVIAGAANYSVFATLVTMWRLAGPSLWAAMVVGSAFGLIVSFAGSRLIVFGAPGADPGG